MLPDIHTLSERPSVKECVVEALRETIQKEAEASEERQEYLRKIQGRYRSLLRLIYKFEHGLDGWELEIGEGILWNMFRAVENEDLIALIKEQVRANNFLRNVR